MVKSLDRFLFKTVEKQKFLTNAIALQDCSICKDFIEDPQQTPCRHIFCNPCITKLCKERGVKLCPLCNEPIQKRSLKPREELKEDLRDLKFIKFLISHIGRNSEKIKSKPPKIQNDSRMQIDNEPDEPLDLSFRSSQKERVAQGVKCYAIKFQKPLDLSMRSRSQEKQFKEFEDDQFLNLFFDSAQQFTQLDSVPSNTSIKNKPEEVYVQAIKKNLYEKEVSINDKLDKSHFFDSDSGEDSNSGILEDDVMCSEDDAVLIEETVALEKSRKIQSPCESEDESDVSFFNPTPSD